MKQQFTQYGGARPFGVSLMLAGINSKKPQLFVSDVTGNYFAYYANAIGENDERIKEELRENYKKSLDLKQGVKLAVEILKKVKGIKFNMNKLELAYIKADGKLKRAEGEGIKEI